MTERDASGFDERGFDNEGGLDEDDFEANDEVDYEADDSAENGDVMDEMLAAEEDGRDGAPVEGSSDAPELMDGEDPLRDKYSLLDEEYEDAGEEMEETELTAKDDDPEW